MKSITDLLGVQQDKFESIVGKTEEAEEKISKSGKSGAAAVGGGDDGGALAVEQQRDESRASERRHNELIQAIKGDGGGSEPTIKDSDGSLGGVGGVIKSRGRRGAANHHNGRVGRFDGVIAGGQHALHIARGANLTRWPFKINVHLIPHFNRIRSRA